MIAIYWKSTLFSNETLPPHNRRFGEIRMVEISNQRGWDNANGDQEGRKDKGVIEGA